MAQAIATKITELEGFTANDGKFIPEFLVDLAVPIDGHDRAYTYSSNLVESLKEGPVEVTHEAKENKFKGYHIVLKPVRGAQMFQGGGTSQNGQGPAKTFHAAPETVALKLTELVVSKVNDIDIEDVVETYKTILGSL